jgi:hypothetical protein
MCDHCEEHRDEYKLPVNNPILSGLAGWIYDKVFEPINKVINWFGRGLRVAEKKPVQKGLPGIEPDYYPPPSPPPTKVSKLN